MSLDLMERIRELPYRLRARQQIEPTGWPVSNNDRQRISMAWPAVYQWPGCAPMMSTLRDALSWQCQFEVKPTRQRHKGVVMLECAVDGVPYLIVVDYSDYPEINRDALDECALYFKFVYAAGGYGDDRVVPGGYTTTHLAYYKHYLHGRVRGEQDRSHDIVARYGFAFQEELRRKALALVESIPGASVLTGRTKVRYPRFLLEAGQSRISIDMPGNAPLSHRLIEFLGLGTCLFAVKYPIQLHVPLVPSVHYVAVSEDLSDLRDLCIHYLANTEERERIAANGRELFDNYLHCDQLAGYYIRTLISRLGSN